MNDEKSDKIGTLIESLKFTPELGPPTLLEFLALVGIVVSLIAVGHLIKGIWSKQNELVPIPVSLLMTLAMFLIYFVLVSMLFNRTPESQRPTLILWSVLALAAPAFYFGRIIVDSFATRVIDQVSPFNMRIEEPSEFAEARKLALRRDIDGAVKRYRAYLENTDAALFEAARLLKSEDRFAEAAVLFQEIAERFYSRKPVWAEATYHLARLQEANLHRPQEAMALLEGVLDRSPDSRFGQLAAPELARMQSLYAIEPGRQESYVEPPDTDDPFYRQRNKQSPGSVSEGEGNGQRRSAGDTEQPVPPADPFYAATARQSAERDEGENAAADPHESNDEPSDDAGSER